MAEQAGERFAHEESALAGGAGAALWRANNLLQRRQKAVLDPFGLTPVQYLLLAGLAELSGRGRPVTQVVLARRCGADAMMVSQVLRELERRGLVQRDTHPADSRAFALRPTSSGRALFDRASPALEESQDAFFAALGADADAFAGALRLLAGEKPRRRVKAGQRE